MRYRSQQAHAARATEESVYLLAKVACAFNWLEEREAFISSRIARKLEELRGEAPGAAEREEGAEEVVGGGGDLLGVESGGDATSAAAAAASLTKGKVVLLERERARLAMIRRDAEHYLTGALQDWREVAHQQ